MSKFVKTYSKINTSEAVWGIKLKLCCIVSNISLYKKIFLLPLFMHFGCYGNLVSINTMGIVTIEINCYLTADILTNVL